MWRLRARFTTAKIIIHPNRDTDWAGAELTLGEIWSFAVLIMLADLVGQLVLSGTIVVLTCFHHQTCSDFQVGYYPVVISRSRWSGNIAVRFRLCLMYEASAQIGRPGRLAKYAMNSHGHSVRQIP